jgi:ATP-dependent RNA helicase DHX57
MKQLLPSYPWLKLVLMSATLDAELFSSYFGGCPILSVEGRTFPVEQFYLEDVYELLQYSPDHTVRTGGLKADEMESRLANLRQKLPRAYEPAVLQSLATVRPDAIDYRLLEQLVWWIVDTKPAGGILIFLPGQYEITKLCGALERTTQTRQTNEKYWILPLHGSLSSSNQQKVFSKAPSSTRKIVVATNIAETSITVEDILYVIDSGRMKQVEYDATNKMSALVETFVSQAAANQRKGRAGRVKEGTCFRLYSSVHWNEHLPSHQLPELHRSALDHVLLQVKLLGLDTKFASGGAGLQRVLSMCIQPPAPLAVASAVETLTEAQALDERQGLTPLGSHLARLPIDNVRIGKLLLYAAMFGCVTAMTRCAAVLGGKPLFVSGSFDVREEADRKKMAFAHGRSDALTQLRAFQAWLDVKQSQGQRAASNFAQENFLSHSALDSALELANSYYRGLEEIGFAAPRGGGGGRGGGRGGGGGGGNGANADALRLQDDQGDVPAVLSAVLTAAFYPNVLSIEAPAEMYAQGAHGAVAVEQDSKLFKFFHRSPKDGSRQRVFLHPRSVNFKATHFESPFLTYLSMQQSNDKLVVHDSQLAMPYPLLLFGRHLHTELERGLVVVDGFMHFKCPPRIAALLRALRTFLNNTLEAKIKQPKLDIRASPVISAILRIISTNGF